MAAPRTHRTHTACNVAAMGMEFKMTNNTAAVTVTVTGVLLPGATVPNTRVGKASHAVAVTLGNGQTKVTTFHATEAMAVADAAAVVAKAGRYATASVAAWYAAK